MECKASSAVLLIGFLDISAEEGKGISSLAHLAALIVLFILLSSTAVAVPNTDGGQPISLCGSGEKVLFSCNIRGKKLSLCGSQMTAEGPLLVQYRFGQPGIAPELKYPSEPTTPLLGFDFGTTYDSKHDIPLQIISFSRLGATYDIITPDQILMPGRGDDEPPFTGVGVTNPGNGTKLLSCEKNTITVNLASLKTSLGLSVDAPLSASWPKYPFEKLPYVTKNIACGSDCTCTVSYPVINDPVVDSYISSFMGVDCNDTEVTKRATASIALGEYLNLTLVRSLNSHGAPHGDFDEDIKLFRKEKNGWAPLKKEALFDLSAKCTDKINSLLIRQLTFEYPDLDYPRDLLGEAQVRIESKGINFDLFQLSRYPEYPSTLLSYKELGSCLRIAHEGMQQDQTSR